MEKFIELMAEIFEVEPEEISLSTDFREDIEEFNSLIGFSMIVTMEEDFNVIVSVDEFLKCKTLKDLYDKIG